MGYQVGKRYQEIVILTEQSEQATQDGITYIFSGRTENGQFIEWQSRHLFSLPLGVNEVQVPFCNGDCIQVKFNLKQRIKNDSYLVDRVFIKNIHQLVPRNIDNQQIKLRLSKLNEWIRHEKNVYELIW